MNRVTRGLSLSALFGSLILALITGAGISPGHSQSGSIGGAPGSNDVNGIELYLNKDPNTKLYGNDDFLTGSSLCGQWMQNKGALEQALVAATGVLNSSGQLPKGVTIVRQSANLSKNCTAHATNPTGFLEISANLLANEFVFNLTTPGPWPQGLDPRLSITFDLAATARVEIPMTARQVTLGPAQLRLSNVAVLGKNFSGDAALTAAGIVKFFTGQDLLAEVTKNRTFEFGGAKTELASFSKALDDAAQRLPSLESEFDLGRRVIILRGPGGSDSSDNRCASGFVWREAVAGDAVCVTPDIRVQALADNQYAAERRVRNPAGQISACRKQNQFDNFARNQCIAQARAVPCKPGFVWRTAVPTDYVCVTPQARAQVQEDNRLAGTRRVAPAPAEVIH